MVQRTLQIRDLHGDGDGGQESPPPRRLERDVLLPVGDLRVGAGGGESGKGDVVVVLAAPSPGAAVILFCV